MRAAPPITISPSRFGIWNAAIVALGLAGAASLLAWAVFRSEPLPALGWVAVVGSLLGSGWWLVRPLLQTRAMTLAWDGRSWQLGPGSDALIVGELVVALDFGAWLLLRFTASWPEAPGRRRRVHWLPVQRRGLESSWHALRCAVHSPRPAALAAATSAATAGEATAADR